MFILTTTKRVQRLRDRLAEYENYAGELQAENLELKDALANKKGTKRTRDLSKEVDELRKELAITQQRVAQKEDALVWVKNDRDRYKNDYELLGKEYNAMLRLKTQAEDQLKRNKREIKHLQDLNQKYSRQIHTIETEGDEKQKQKYQQLWAIAANHKKDAERYRDILLLCQEAVQQDSTLALKRIADTINEELSP